MEYFVLNELKSILLFIFLVYGCWKLFSKCASVSCKSYKKVRVGDQVDTGHPKMLNWRQVKGTSWPGQDFNVVLSNKFPADTGNMRSGVILLKYTNVNVNDRKDVALKNLVSVADSNWSPSIENKCCCAIVRIPARALTLPPPKQSISCTQFADGKASHDVGIYTCTRSSFRLSIKRDSPVRTTALHRALVHHHRVLQR